MNDFPIHEATPSVSLTEKLRALRDVLLSELVERDVAIRLALLAALAGEHVFLLGPPGTAKSLVARRLHMAFSGATYFERLLSRFTVPEELFGPLSIKGLEEDRYERLTDAYLPTASTAFLDEIFKANSAILNALLTLLNEREFDNGAKRTKTPLIAVVGASNELPEGDELDALFDRFLLRLHVGPVSADAFPSLLRLRGQAVPEVPAHLKLTTADLVAIQQTAEEVEVTSDVEVMLCTLRDWCTAEKMPVSDRRWRKIVKLLQVSAFTNGRAKVSVWDCWLLQHCLWGKPEERPKVYDWYCARVGASAALDPSRLTRVVVSWEGKLKADQESRSQARDESGRLLYRKADGTFTTDARGKLPVTTKGEAMFLAPPSASTHGGYHAEQYRIQDRTNEGKGYTREELEQLWVIAPNRSRAQFSSWADRDAYLAEPSNRLLREGELPPCIEPTRHKNLYVEDCLRNIDELRFDVVAYRVSLREHTAAMGDAIRSHLWVTQDFVEPAQANLEQSRHDVETLLNRVEMVRKGFALLPREPAFQPIPEPTPAPVHVAPKKAKGK